MASTVLGLLLLLARLLLTGVGAPASAGAITTPSAPPNIVFMLSDDQSWDGLSVAMHPSLDGARSRTIDTPRLERMAADGLRFSAAYAPAPVCAPTRASLLTGRSPASLQWTKAGPSLTAADNPPLLPPVSRRQLQDAWLTYAEVLREAGYATAHFGKWHVDGGGPERHGFEVSDGNLGNEAAARFTDPNPVDIFGMAERAEAFMATSRDEGRPFFVQLSWHALHAPENALAATRAKYAARFGPRGRERAVDRAALSEDLDSGVGRVLDALDRLGLAENTYVIFMSDNGGGGGGRGRALTGGKGTIGEGGIRVPLIVRGPGIEPGSWSHTRVVGYDLFPTFVEWAGADAGRLEAAASLEGGSLAPLLRGDEGRVARSADALVFHFPHYQGAGGPQSCIIDGDTKLTWFHETGRVALHDLARDPGERRDLSGERPESAAALRRRLEAQLQRTGAAMPVTNERYDPTRETRLRQPGRGQAGRGQAGRGQAGRRRGPGN